MARDQSSGVGASGEREEQPLELRGIHGSGLIRVRETSTQPARDDREPGTVERARYRRDLHHDVATVSSLIEHPDHACDLTLGSAESADERRDVLALQLHR
jgi:hypothetical protein